MGRSRRGGWPGWSVSRRTLTRIPGTTPSPRCRTRPSSGLPRRPAGPGGGGGPVNLNTATVTELQTLPGIGAVLAQRIVEYRDRHGGFRAVTDLRQVEGIGDAKFQQLKDRVTV